MYNCGTFRWTTKREIHLKQGDSYPVTAGLRDEKIIVKEVGYLPKGPWIAVVVQVFNASVCGIRLGSAKLGPVRHTSESLVICIDQRCNCPEPGNIDVLVSAEINREFGKRGARCYV
jgi:hypothetical protein